MAREGGILSGVILFTTCNWNFIELCNTKGLWWSTKNDTGLKFNLPKIQTDCFFNLLCVSV